MGVDINVRVVVGVKLKSRSELFDTVKELRFGCHHKIKDSKYCPKCGRLAQREHHVDVPKLAMREDESAPGIKILADRYFVIDDYEMDGKEVYVCTYHKALRCLNQSFDEALRLPQHLLEKELAAAERMVSFLSAFNLLMESNTPSVFVIPYYS